MLTDFNTAVSMLKNADKILILTHRNPDGDTLGSGFALLRALRKMGKRAKLLNADRISEKYIHLYEGLTEDNFSEEFIVSVDVAERKLLGDTFMEKYADRVDLSFDHHGAGKPFAKMTYNEPDSASACEIIYSVIKALGVEIDKKIADCIYTGCSTDTGCFKYSNVTARTHRIAAELIEYGADCSRINEKMFDTKSMNSISLERMCYESLEVFGGGKVAVITVTKEMLVKSGTDKSHLDAIKPITRQIEGVEIGLTVKEEDGGAAGVSIRTSENYDASLICSHFGGGGHIRAGGCEIKDTTENAKAKVVDYILNNIL
ncbi:MAG: DHH family phosphoesterase [Clostridia bacterium]|nr:DHH family phosphoesterase [Clostridia bacterium]